MLGAISSFNLCPRNDFILTQVNIDNTVNDLSSGTERWFPESLVSISVLFTAAESPLLCHSQFYYLHLLLLKFLADAGANTMP